MDAWDVIEWLFYVAYYDDAPIGRGPFFMEVLTTIVSIITLPLLSALCAMGISRFNLILKHQEQQAAVVSDLSQRVVAVEANQRNMEGNVSLLPELVTSVAALNAKVEMLVPNSHEQHG